MPAANIASADWRHFGRLAGYANLKPERRQPDGTQPHATLIEAFGVLAEQAKPLLIEADEIEADEALRKPAESSRIQRSSSFHRALNGWSPGQAYAWYAQRITAGQPSTDPSRLDWIVLCNMASSSLAVDQAYLEQALQDGSPDLARRKVGHLEHYVSHTAAKVLNDPHVMAARKELSARILCLFPRDSPNTVKNRLLLAKITVHCNWHPIFDGMVSPNDIARVPDQSGMVATRVGDSGRA